MPLYKASLRMAHDVTWPQRRKWSTTFYIEEGNPTAAAAVLDAAWRDYLRGAVDQTIFAYEVYATSVAEGDDSYYVGAIATGEQRGTGWLSGLGYVRGEPYLPKVCLTVTLPVANSRPSRKFWRWGAREGDVLNGVSVQPAITSVIADRFNAMLGDAEIGAVMRDPDNQALAPAVGRIRLSTREFGRQAGADVPEAPAVA